jgi:hypothetical protein
MADATEVASRHIGEEDVGTEVDRLSSPLELLFAPETAPGSCSTNLKCLRHDGSTRGDLRHPHGSIGAKAE